MLYPGGELLLKGLEAVEFGRKRLICNFTGNVQFIAALCSSTLEGGAKHELHRFSEKWGNMSI